MRELAYGLLLALDVLLAFGAAACWVGSHAEYLAPEEQATEWRWFCAVGSSCVGLTWGLLRHAGFAALHIAFNALCDQFEFWRGLLVVLLLLFLVVYCVVAAWQLRQLNLARRQLHHPE